MQHRFPAYSFSACLGNPGTACQTIIREELWRTGLMTFPPANVIGVGKRSYPARIQSTPDAALLCFSRLASYHRLHHHQRSP